MDSMSVGVLDYDHTEVHIPFVQVRRSRADLAMGVRVSQGPWPSPALKVVSSHRATPS